MRDENCSLKLKSEKSRKDGLKLSLPLQNQENKYKETEMRLKAEKQIAVENMAIDKIDMEEKIGRLQCISKSGKIWLRIRSIQE